MAATRDFYDDFNAYSVGVFTFPNGWQADHNTPNVVSIGVDSGSPYIGNRMLRLNNRGGAPSDYESAGTPSISHNNESFYRLVWRCDDNALGAAFPGGGHKIMRGFWPNGDGLDKFCVMHGTGAGTLTNSGIWASDTNQHTYFGGVGGGSAAWWTVEMYFNVTSGATAASYKIWHNNGTNPANRVLTTSVSGLDAFGLKQLYMALFSSTTDWVDQDSYMYLGMIEVFSDSGTGEATTGSMSDASIEAVVGSPGGGGGNTALLSLLHNSEPFMGA